jgi:hypothetical protein
MAAGTQQLLAKLSLSPRRIRTPNCTTTATQPCSPTTWTIMNQKSFWGFEGTVVDDIDVECHSIELKDWLHQIIYRIIAPIVLCIIVGGWSDLK